MNLVATSDYDGTFTVGTHYSATEIKGNSVRVQGFGDTWYGLSHFSLHTG